MILTLRLLWCWLLCLVADLGMPVTNFQSLQSRNIDQIFKRTTSVENIFLQCLQLKVQTPQMTGIQMTFGGVTDNACSCRCIAVTEFKPHRNLPMTGFQMTFGGMAQVFVDLIK